MKYFVLVLCILFSGVFSKTALKRNESDKDGITSPLLWLIIQQLNALGSRVEKLRDIANESQKEIISVKRDMADLKSKYGGGGTYVRWGKTNCPTKNGTTLVYSGSAGGGYYGHSGSPAEPVCLPTDPNFLKKPASNPTYIYGTEFQSKFFGSNAVDQDVPCSVCHVQFGTTLMIPGKTTCNKGWKLEYAGNLAAGAIGQAAASSYLCVDLNPDYVHHGGHGYIGYILYEVVGQCGSLPCPPYRHGYPLTCAVCSK